MSISEIKDELVQNKNYFIAFKNRIKESGLLLNLETKKDKVLYYMHAEFVQQLFSDKEYYQLILKKDNMVNKVLNQ
jgi:carboxyl-terminal processing protease